MTKRPKITLRRGVHVHPAKRGIPYWWFRISARNGKPLVTSEMYHSKAAAITGIRAVVSACVWIDAKADALFEDRT